MRILEFERQTWQLVCEKFGAGGGDSAATPHLRFADSEDSHTPGVSWQA
jgi:hypothetical protein